MECRCLKWARMTHLDIWNTSYGQKKGRESSPDSLAWKYRATYCWKAIDEGYNFASDLISIEGLHKKICAPKVAGISILGISRLPLGNPGTKCHLDVGPMARHRMVMVSHKFGPWWVLWVRVRLWLVLAPKVFQLHTNQLVFGFV